MSLWPTNLLTNAGLAPLSIMIGVVLTIIVLYVAVVISNEVTLIVGGEMLVFPDNIFPQQ